MDCEHKVKSATGGEVIGLVPAGGTASRLAPLPCSKELYPVGFRRIDENGGVRSKVVCHYLLESMRSAGISKAFIILREGKWDIPAYLRDGKIAGMNLAYLIMDRPFGVPFTLDQAFPFVQDALVVLGFPDIVFQPEDAITHLLNQQAGCKSDVVLGLFPAPHPRKMDMVDFHPDGRVYDIQIKPERTLLTYTWIIAVWGPRFTRFMHEYVMAREGGESEPGADGIGTRKELHVSEVIMAALENGFQVDSVLFRSGSCLDIGTPDDLLKACRNATAPTRDSG